MSPNNGLNMEDKYSQWLRGIVDWLTNLFCSLSRGMNFFSLLTWLLARQSYYFLPWESIKVKTSS